MSQTRYIPIHSIVALITNSSSEIFTYAASDSVSQIKSLIGEFLKLAKSDKDVDDLFKVEIVSFCYDDRPQAKEYSAWYTDDEIEKLNAEEGAENGLRKREVDDVCKTKIRVTALVDEAKEVAAILSKLDDLFDSSEVCN